MMNGNDIKIILVHIAMSNYIILICVFEALFNDTIEKRGA